MFTTEIRINGALIAHIYCRKLRDDDPIEDLTILQQGQAQYLYEFYEVENRYNQPGTIVHHPDDGILLLVRNLIDKIEANMPAPDAPASLIPAADAITPEGGISL